MALPATISGVQFPDQNYHVGPFEDSNGNLYVIFVDDADPDHLEAVKSTDGGETWASQDTANPLASASNSQPIVSIWVAQEGSTLHVATQHFNSGMSNQRPIGYVPFDTGTDAFGTDSPPAGTMSDESTHAACSIVVRSNGDLILVAQGPADRVMGTGYSRVHYYKSTDGGSSWSSETLVSGTSSDTKHYTGPVAAVGANDRVHFFYENQTNDNALHRSLNSSDTFDTEQKFSDTQNTPIYSFSEAVSDGTDVWVLINDSDATLNEWTATSGADPTFSVADVSDSSAIRKLNGNVVASLARTGTDRHALWSQQPSGSFDWDLMHDQDTGSGWGTDENLTGASINRVSSRVLTDLSYVYDNAGTVYYDVYSLSSGGDQSQISWAELEVPLAPRQLQFSWGELEVPGAPRKSQTSWAELETPDAARTSQTSWEELEVPDAPRQLQFSWGEFETPDAPRSMQMSWGELEVPDGPRKSQTSWAELETPDAARRSQTSWGELEVPDAPRKAQASWTELEVPSTGRKAQVSWGELETPDAPRKSQTSWGELEVPTAPRASQLSWGELEVPDGPRQLQLSWSELEAPDAPRAGQVSWEELEVPETTRKAQVSWEELETPDAPRTSQFSWSELEVPDEPRIMQFSWTELEVPTAPRKSQTSWEELEVPHRSKAQVSWAEFQVPNAEGAPLTKRDRVYFPGKEWKTPKPRE